MRYAIALEQGGWVVRDVITGRSETQPATSEEAQQAVAEWNARCVTRQVDPPVKVDGWGPVGELRAWLLAEDGWWGLVAGRTGVRWIRAEDLASPEEGPERTPGSGLPGLGQVTADQVTDGMPPSDPGVVKRSSPGVCPPVGVARA